MRQIVVDTETTGLEAATHRIIEFAAMEMVNRKLTGKQLHLYIDPQRDIDAEAQRIHGISAEQLHGQPVFADVAEQIAEFIRGAELIIHNAPFDMAFLDEEMQRANFPRASDIVGGVIDTLEMARQERPGKRNNLDTLCDVYGVDRSKRVLHGALIDVALLSDVYLAMTRGQWCLIEEFDDEDVAVGVETENVVRRPENVVFKTLLPTEEELHAHEAYLNFLDKKLGKTCVWRTLGTQGDEW